MQNEIHACENFIKVQQEEINKIMTERNSSSEKIEEVVNKIESSFKKRLTNIEEKIDNVTDKKPKKSFADVTKVNKDQGALACIKEVIRSEKIEDQLEEQRKPAKQSIIIIHGVPES